MLFKNRRSFFRRRCYTGAMLPSAQTLPDRSWTDEPQTRAVMAALGEPVPHGVSHKALFVGGCVRNALLGRAVEDIDIATVLTPEEATGALEKAGIKVVPTGIVHGTVTAVTGGRAFEITTLRRDVETDGRRAVVAFTEDWTEDAQRRDFTMNTLLADGRGRIYDPTGRGLADLQAGRVVFVGDAAQRIAEDYLRILRFFRFHAACGKGAPDEAGLAACRAAAERIAGLSRERVTNEFLKILAVDDPVDVLGVMKENNILSDCFHGGYNPDLLRRLCLLQNFLPPGVKEGDCGNALTARLIILSDFDKNHLDVLGKWMVFSGALKNSYFSILAALESLDTLSEKTLKTLIYKEGYAVAVQSALLRAAKGGLDPASILASIADWQPPRFPVSGDDVIAAGVTRGPQVGILLKSLEEWWVKNDFKPNRIECMARLAEMI